MSMKLVSTFPLRLKEALGQTSATEFAQAIGVSKQTISAYLNGTRKPKAPTIQVMCDALHVNQAWLLGYETDKHPIQPYRKNDLYLRIYDIPAYITENPNMPEVQKIREAFFSKDELLIIDVYRSLNLQGKEYILQTVDMVREKYKKHIGASSMEASNEIV